MFSPVCLGRETLQISVPTVWPVISTKGVYQTPETSCGPTQTDRPTFNNLFGRHAFYACKQGTTKAHGTIDSESLRGLGPYGEQSEVTSNAHTTYRILEISDQFMQSIALLTLEKGKKIQQEACKLLQRHTLSAREMAIFIGKVSATFRAPWQASLHYRALQRNLNSVIAGDASQEQALQEQPDRYTPQVLMKPELKRDLQWWAMTELWTLGTAICTPSSPTELDASQKGWGASCMETSTGELWSVTEAQHHINYLELLAVFLALKTFASNQKGLILLKMDNVSAVTYIRQNTLHSIVQFSTANLGVVHSEKDHVTGRASARLFQCSGRYRIPDSQGQMRLDDKPQKL